MKTLLIFIALLFASYGHAQIVSGTRGNANITVTGTATIDTSAVTVLTANKGTLLGLLLTPVTVAVDSGLSLVDTLKLGASGVYSVIRVRGKSGASDSVTTITGGVSNQIYLFSAVADDTTITFVDGSNLKLGANRVLDLGTDQLFVRYDGTNFREIAFVNND
jgi:hypothetical protein